MSLLGVVVAEARKAATLPAVWAGAAIALLGSAAITALNGLTVRHAIAAGATDRVADTSPFETAFAAIPVFGVVGAVVIGVVAMGSEYTTTRTDQGGSRQITTTLASAPHRLTLFLAKSAVVATLAGVTVAASSAANVWLARVVIGSGGEETVALDQAVSRTLGAAIFGTLTALMALAVTAITRNGILPLVVFITNGSVVSVSLLLANVTPLAAWLPDAAGRELFGFPPEYAIKGALDTVPGALVMGAWTLLGMAAGGAAFARRDA